MAALQLCKVKTLCHLWVPPGVPGCLAPKLLSHILLELLPQGSGVERLVDTVLPGIALGIYPSVWLGGSPAQALEAQLQSSHGAFGCGPLGSWLDSPKGLVYPLPIHL